MTASSEAEIATDLVVRIKRGDAVAEAELVARYSRGLLFLLLRMGGDEALAEDLHQETFKVALVRLRQQGLAEPARLAGFLRGTARNLLIGEHRKSARRQTEPDQEAVQAAADGSSGQLSRLIDDEESRLVRRLIDELEQERDRQLLFRFYIAEEEKEQICSDLGLSSLHFNRVLFRARQRLKQLLEGAAERPGQRAAE